MDDYVNMDEEEGNGIIQAIEQPLEFNDYIEIDGICRGEIVLVELLSDSIPPTDDTPILPLQLLLQQGVVMATGRKYNTKEQCSWTVKNGIQDNQHFKLCIHVRQDNFEIFLNNQLLGTQKYVVNPSTIGAIGMYGDAEFTSIEFKDSNCIEDDAQSDKGSELHPGFVRVEEKRESQKYPKAAPLLVRSSTRRSGSFRKSVGKTGTEIQPTLSNAHYESPSTTTMRSSSKSSLFGNRKSVSLENNNDEHKYAVGGAQSSTLAGSAIRGSYQRVDDERASPVQSANPGSSVDVSGKKRFSLFGKNRSESDIQMADGDKKGRKSKFGKKGSTKNLQDSKTSLRSSSYTAIQGRTPSMTSLGGSMEKPISIGPIPKHALKDDAAEIAGYVSAQKVLPEFEHFMLTDAKDKDFIDARNQFKSSQAVSSKKQTAPADDRKREIKGTAPEMADILFEQRKATFDTKISLTEAMVDTRYSSVAQQLSEDKYKKEHVQKPTKVDGNAPELAAIFNDYANVTYQYPPQLGLTGMIEYQKPKIDTDKDEIFVDDRGQVESMRPIETQSLKEGNSDDDRSSSGSTVYTDNEYYLEVGKSAYYMERKKSLKKYRSRRSIKQEKAAREAMGLDKNSSSSGSSISLVKPDDKRLTPKTKHRQTDFSPSAWGNDDEIYSSQSKPTKTYAAPPQMHQRLIPLRDEKIGCIELRNKNFQVDFPKPITQGRKAKISGHFIDSFGEVKYCQIRLGHNIYVDNNRYDDLIVEISSMGQIALIGMEPHLWTVSNTGFATEKQMEDNGQFILDLCIKDTVFQITLNDLVTLEVYKVSDATTVTSVQLTEQPSAELDEIVSYIGMLLPLSLSYYKEASTGSISTLMMKTKFTAKSKGLRLGFTRQSFNTEEECMAIVFDYTSSRLMINSIYFEEEQQPFSAELPFVPEQIRKIEVDVSPQEYILKVQVNYNVLLQIQLPIVLVNNWPTMVKISGDMVLLDAMMK